jgi:hypothetical protein
MPSKASIQLNETFDIMMHPDRRYVLYHLSETSDAVDFDTLVSRVVAWNERHTDTAGIGDRESVAVTLRHVHLPKLDAAGFVRFDADAGTVELGEAGPTTGILDDAASIDEFVPSPADD